MLNAREILDALRAAHPDAAFVAEVDAPHRRAHVQDAAAHRAKRAPWADVTHRFVYVIPEALHEAVAGMYGTHNLHVRDAARVAYGPHTASTDVERALLARGAEREGLDQNGREDIS